MTFDCIVSLTTWKGRISNPDLPKVLYSIFRQETSYNFRTVMTLSTADFPNREDDLGETLNLFIKNDLMDVVWVDDNLKALKKIYPVMEMYPDIPIMTTDDDIILSKNAVDTFMTAHAAHPGCILTETGHRLTYRDEICTGFFRLFPPNCLYRLSPDYFVKYFDCCEDDMYMAMLAKLRGTKTMILRAGICRELKNRNYVTTCLRSKYRKIPWVRCRRNLIKALAAAGIRYQK